MGSILYILYPTLASQVRFLVYNMSDNTFIPDQYISSRRHMQGCVASFENMIYVTGGWDINSDDSRAVSILDLSTEGWSTGTSMNEKRGLHGCVVVPDNRMLYAIGGRDNQGVLNQYLNSVESISIDLFNSWTTMTDVLSESQQGVRAVIYEDYKILVLPGEFQGPYYSDVIEIINTRNNSIYSSNYRLPRAMMSSSPVVVGNKLYNKKKNIFHFIQKYYNEFSTLYSRIQKGHISLKNFGITATFAKMSQKKSGNIMNLSDGICIILYIY